MRACAIYRLSDSRIPVSAAYQRFQLAPNIPKSARFGKQNEIKFLQLFAKSVANYNAEANRRTRLTAMYN
jgi:hypothetical protein